MKNGRSLLRSSRHGSLIHQSWYRAYVCGLRRCWPSLSYVPPSVAERCACGRSDTGEQRTLAGFASRRDTTRGGCRQRRGSRETLGASNKQDRLRKSCGYVGCSHQQMLGEKVGVAPPPSSGAFCIFRASVVVCL